MRERPNCPKCGKQLEARCYLPSNMGRPYLCCDACQVMIPTINDEGDTIEKLAVGKEVKLTLQDLKDMKPGIFAKGEVIDGPDGCNMSGSGKMLRWVASRGQIYDWAIYVLFADNDWLEVKRVGDKVHNPANIRKLVPCDEEAFEMYRH